MKKPKRYTFKVNEENDFDLIEHSNGEFVRYEDYVRLKAEVDALDTDVKATWKENRELRDRIDLLTAPLWLRVVAWLVSFVGAFWLVQILLNWMHR